MAGLKPVLQTEVLSTRPTGHWHQLFLLAARLRASVSVELFGLVTLAVSLYMVVHPSVGVLPLRHRDWLGAQRTHWHLDILGIALPTAVLVVRPVVLTKYLVTRITLEW